MEVAMKAFVQTSFGVFLCMLAIPAVAMLALAAWFSTPSSERML
jgi:hypothetical protein